LPRISSLWRFVEGLLRDRGEGVVSIILFGSMAKGSYTIYSDYDVLVVSRHEEPPLKVRLYEYSKYSDGWVEPFVYTTEEVKRMLRSFNMLILDALKDGIVIHDKGFWSTLKGEFDEMLRSGILMPKENGWIIRGRDPEGH
jgi:predicted nucleotidyltransferase